MSQFTPNFPQCPPTKHASAPLVQMHKMQPNELCNGGQNLSINYSFVQSDFGPLLVGSTPLGICHAFFYEDKNEALNTLKRRFPNAFFKLHNDKRHKQVFAFVQVNHCVNESFIEHRPDIAYQPVALHLAATDFQLAVWQALLNIPFGQVSTYGKVAALIKNASAARAVGSAIGKNAVACVIPCHRVIQKGGALGGYRWGVARKAALLAWEASI